MAPGAAEKLTVLELGSSNCDRRLGRLQGEETGFYSGWTLAGTGHREQELGSAETAQVEMQG